MSRDDSARRYDASGRQRDAELRRARVIDAARDLFLTQGYGPTSIDQVARQAGTSAQTVYAAFGNKAGLLRRVIDVSVVGDDLDVALIDRPEFRDMLASPDLEDRLRVAVSLAAVVHRRSARLVDMVERSSGSDPVLAALREELHGFVRLDAERMLATVPDELLRTDMTRDQIVDVVAEAGSPTMWCRLVVDRGWTDEQYERWFGDTVRHALFGPPA